MNFQAQSFQRYGDLPRGACIYVPPQVEQLAAREREVASIVYRFGYATAKDVQSELSEPVSNGAVRSMLVRLVAKGILRRRRGKRGAGCSDLFIAALSIDHARSCALAKLAEDFFGGSLSELDEFVAGISGRTR